MCSSYRDLSAHSGGVAGFVLPMSKSLVHWDSESDQRVPRWRIVSVDRELVMG